MNLPTRITDQVSRFLRICLWTATLAHGGLILWACWYLCALANHLKLGPVSSLTVTASGIGADSRTFQVYLWVLTVNLLWETVRTTVFATGETQPLKPWKKKAGPGEVALVFWACFLVIAWYSRTKGLIPSLPDYLVKTLAVCVLLWVLQKMVVKSWRKSRAAHPAPSVSQNPPAVSAIPLPANTPADPSNIVAREEKTLTKEEVQATPKPRPQRTKKTRTKAPKRRARKTDVPTVSTEDLEKKLLDLVRSKGKVKAGELADELGVTRRTVNRYHEKLLKDGRLEVEGKGKAAVYRIKE